MTTAARSPRGVAPELFIDEEWLARHTEAVLEPKRPIVDAHHHLWHRASRYLVEELVEDLNCGHDIRGTVFVEAGAMYRADGDPNFKCVGEVEYANGVGAVFASNYWGSVRACAGIVSNVNLTLGAAAEEVMLAQVSRAPDRMRGVRHMAAWDASPVVSRLRPPPPKGLLLDRKFREGFSKLMPNGLLFDAWVYHPQLPELLDLIDAFPYTPVVVDHCGGLVQAGPYAVAAAQARAAWEKSMRELARRPNVFVKIGGLNLRVLGNDLMDRDLPPSSEELEVRWRPVIEVCIEAFGADRAMFESNFPPDKCGCSAKVLWNAFKRIAQNCSDSEKAALFAGTAVRAYRLPGELAQPTVHVH
jgi:L-fuconolactonase